MGSDMKKMRDISYYRPVVLTPRMNRNQVITSRMNPMRPRKRPAIKNSAIYRIMPTSPNNMAI